MKSSPAEGVEVREVEKRDNFIPSPALNLLLPGRKVASERKRERNENLRMKSFDFCENSRIDRFQAAAA